MNEVVKIGSYEAKKRMKLGRYEDKRLRRQEWTRTPFLICMLINERLTSVRGTNCAIRKKIDK